MHTHTPVISLTVLKIFSFLGSRALMLLYSSLKIRERESNRFNLPYKAVLPKHLPDKMWLFKNSPVLFFVYLPFDSCDQEVQAALNLSAVYKAVNILWVYGLSGGCTGARTRWTKKSKIQIQNNKPSGTYRKSVSTPLQQEIILSHKIIAILCYG